MTRKSSVPRQSMARPSTSGRPSAVRQSTVGARPSTSGIARPSISRMSSVGGMGRPSTAGRAAKVDVKANLNSNIKYMLNYLTENSYPQTLSKKNLVNPTEATFKDVFQFILQNLSPTFDMKRIGTAVPEYLLALGYPYTLKESYFKPVGSPHSWPYVLESLVWLTKFAQQSDYERENVSTLLTMACQDKVHDDETELWHLAESRKLYKKFNDGTCALDELVDEYKVRRNSQKRCAMKQLKIDELKAKISALREKKNGHAERQKKSAKDLADKHQKTESAKQDVIVFEELKTKSEKDKAVAVHGGERHEKRQEELVESLEHIGVQQADLENTISKQPPQLQVQKEKQRMKLHKDQRTALKADTDKKIAECWKAEVEDTNTQQKIREDFRQRDERLRKVTSKHCIKMDGIIDNKNLVQVKSTLGNVTEKAKTVREESAKVEHKLYKEQVQVQELQEDYTLLEDNLKSKASQRKYKEEDNERTKQKMARGSARLDEEVEQCRKRLNELKTELNIELDVSTIDEKLIRLLAEIEDETERDDILRKMSLLKCEELQGASASLQFNKSLMKLFKGRSPNLKPTSNGSLKINFVELKDSLLNL